MKKVLFATTALMLTGGAALAEVTIGGNGRFGLLYEDQSGSEVNETIVSYRLRFNIDASRETDSGVTFGGRIRMQYSSGDTDAIDQLVTDASGVPLRDINGDLVFGTEGKSGAGLSAAKLYASYEGLTLEVGNVDTAFDSAALLYNSEMGYLDRSFGDPQGSFYSFSSGAYGADEADRLGIALTYSIGDFNGRISWVTPNQTGQIRNLSCDTIDTSVPGVSTCTDPDYGTFVDDERDDEISLSGDYTFGDFIVSAAYYNNGGGIKDNEGWFLGGEYNFQDMGAVGLLYIDNGDLVPDVDTAGDLGETWTLYGNYKINDVIAKGYIAYNSELGDAFADGNSTVVGIGADYDLGGATLSGSIQQGFSGDATADIGVRFTF